MHSYTSQVSEITTDSDKTAMRVRLVGEERLLPIYGPLPAVGDTVKVVVVDDAPYIDTTVRS